MMPVAVLVLAAAAGAALNSVVGGGALLTFLALTSSGVRPLAAGVTSSIALLPGSATGAWAGRAHLPAWRQPVLLVTVVAVAGGAGGAGAALILSPATFTAVVPWLIGAATLIVLAGGLPRHHQGLPPLLGRRRPWIGYRPWIGAASMAAGVYGGYFSAAQGVAFLALLEHGWPGLTTPQLVAVKNVAATGVLAAAVTVFAAAGRPVWAAVAVMAPAGILGGQAGACAGARLPAWVLRAVVAGVGAAAIIHAVAR